MYLECIQSICTDLIDIIYEYLFLLLEAQKKSQCVNCNTVDSLIVLIPSFESVNSVLCSNKIQHD